MGKEHLWKVLLEVGKVSSVVNWRKNVSRQCSSLCPLPASVYGVSGHPLAFILNALGMVFNRKVTPYCLFSLKKKNHCLLHKKYPGIGRDGK